MLHLLFVCLPALAPQDLEGHYRFEDGVPGQPAAGAGTLTDSGPLAVHGTPHGEPLYAPDAPAWCAGNGVALALDGQDDWLEFDSTFVFHAPFGDATLEFSAKVPEPGVHRDLFWTTLSLDQEAPNRFHLNLNPGGELWFDYRDEAGNVHPIVSPGDGVLLDLDV